MKQIHHKTGIKFYKGNPNYEKEYTHLRKLKCVKYKGGKCELCGYNRSARALCFHHKNPEEKDFTFSNKVRSWEKVQRELDKCILVCANCHAEIHDGLIDIPLSDKSSLPSC